MPDNFGGHGRNGIRRPKQLISLPAVLNLSHTACPQEVQAPHFSDILHQSDFRLVGPRRERARAAQELGLTVLQRLVQEFAPTMTLHRSEVPQGRSGIDSSCVELSVWRSPIDRTLKIQRVLPTSVVAVE